MIRRLFEALRYSGDRDCEEDDSFKNVQPSCPTLFDIDKVDINQTWIFSALKYGFNLVPTKLGHPFFLILRLFLLLLFVTLIVFVLIDITNQRQYLN